MDLVLGYMLSNNLVFRIDGVNVNTLKTYDRGTLSDPTHVRVCPMVIEQFSNECRKTKTKVITLANHKGHRQTSEPIKTRSKYMTPAQSAGKRARADRDWFWFNF